MNFTNSDQLEQIRKSENAIKIIDKILPHLPEYGIFDFSSFAKEILLWTPQEIREIAEVKEHIIHLSLNQFQYINEKTRQSYYELNDKGREAKLKGGHFSYLEYLENKKQLENERLERKDKSDRIDLRKKSWEYKYRKLPYFISSLALLSTIISIVIAYKSLSKKLDPKDLQPMQQQIQELQKKLKNTENLYQVDTLLKRGN